MKIEKNNSRSSALSALSAPLRFILGGRTSSGLTAADAPPKAVRLRKPELRADTLGYAGRRFLRGLTPQQIVNIFESADRYIADQVALAAQMEESDDHLNGTLDLRRQSVLRLDTLIEAGDPEDKRSAQAAELAEGIVEQPWFYLLREELLRAVLRQWTAGEILYEQQGNKATRTSSPGHQGGTGGQAASGTLWMPVGFRAVEPERWHFESVEEDGDPVPRFMRQLGRHGDYVEPVAGQFCVHSYSAVLGQPGRYAKLRAVAKLWYLGRLALTEWGGLIDSWFQPFTHITYQQGLGSGEIQTMVDAFLDLASRKVAATPEGTTITMHDVPDQTPHSDFQSFVRRAMSRLLLGQETAQHATAQQETGATLQGQVRDDIRDADALLLDASLNETLFAPWCSWSFGTDVKPPRIRHAFQESVDVEQRGRVFEAAQRIGLPIKREQVYSDLAIEQPGEGDELLVAPAAQTLPQAAEVDDVGFEKEMLRLFAQGQMTRESLFNKTDIEQLMLRVGLPQYPGYEEPWLPIIAPMGQEVTGEVVRDSEGDIVGGDVEEPPQYGGGFGFDWPAERETAETAESAEDTEGVEVPEEEAPPPGSEELSPEQEAKAATLTGIQIEKLQVMLQAVSDGTQSPEVVIQIIEEGYPGIAPEKIRAMVEAALRFGKSNATTENTESAGNSEKKMKGISSAFSAVNLRRLAREYPQAVRHVGGREFLVRPRALVAILATGNKVTKSRGFAAYFERVSKAVRAAGETASNFGELREKLAAAIDGVDTGELAELVHGVTFGGYAAGALETGNKVTRSQGNKARSAGHLVTLSPGHFVTLVAGGGELTRRAFAEAIEMLRQRTNILPKEEFLRLEGLNRARAWTVARQADRAVLADLYDAIGGAVADGETYRDFLDSLNEIMERRGWTGLEPWHAKVVYDQNVGMAYTAGRFDQAQRAGVKYWRYLPSDSANPRPEHKQFYGKVYKLGEGPMPPLDFGCNCGWEVIFEDEVDARQVQENPPEVPRSQEFQFSPGDYFKGVG